jgi:two-component system LytT family response regulator
VSLRILIADDEPVARRRIKRLLKAQPDVEIVGEAGDGLAAVEAIRAQAPDLVFLDVQMPEIDGFGVIAALGTRVPAVIFVTAFDQYAVSAFEVHALDYLLKPFTRQRFDEAVARARQHLTRGDAGVEARLAALIERVTAGSPYLSRIAVRTEKRIRLVETGDIDWIRSADNYVTLRAGGKEYLLRETMDRLEEQLDPHRFARIHRSTIVQVDRITELHPSLHGDFAVILRDGARLTLSRSYRDRVARLLGRPL